MGGGNIFLALLNNKFSLQKKKEPSRKKVKNTQASRYRPCFGWSKRIFPDRLLCSYICTFYQYGIVIYIKFYNPCYLFNLQLCQQLSHVNKYSSVKFLSGWIVFQCIGGPHLFNLFCIIRHLENPQFQILSTK